MCSLWPLTEVWAPVRVIHAVEAAQLTSGAGAHCSAPATSTRIPCGNNPSWWGCFKLTWLPVTAVAQGAPAWTVCSQQVLRALLCSAEKTSTALSLTPYQGDFSCPSEASPCVCCRGWLYCLKNLLYRLVWHFALEIRGKYSKMSRSKAHTDRGLSFLLVVQVTAVHRGKRIWGGDMWITGRKRPGQQESNSWSLNKVNFILLMGGRNDTLGTTQNTAGCCRLQNPFSGFRQHHEMSLTVHTLFEFTKAVWRDPSCCCCMEAAIPRSPGLCSP